MNRTLNQWLSRRFDLARHRSELPYRKPMEGLRGFAMTLVFFVHYVSLVWPQLDESSATAAIAAGLQTVSRSGVDLFFLFSGFLVYGAMISRRKPYWQLVKRRVARIYPTFTVVFVLYVALSWLFPDQNRIPAGWRDGAIYLLQNYLLLPGIFDIEPMITVAWSLSYDTFFYLTIPLVIAALGLRNQRPKVRLALFLGLTLVAMTYTAAYGGHIRLLMFVAGVVLYELMQLIRGTSIRIPGILAPVALIFVLAVQYGWDAYWQTHSQFANAISTLETACLFIGFNIMCLACFTNPDSRFSRILTVTPLRWLGNMSYSYYLIHGLALKGTAMVLNVLLPGVINPNGAGFWILMLVMYLATLAVAGLLFVSVEWPFSLNKPRPNIQPAPGKPGDQLDTPPAT